MAIKDVARFKMGFVPYEIEELTKKMAMTPQGISDLDFIFGHETDEGRVVGSIEYDEALKEYVKRYPEQWEIVQKAVSLSRSRGRHACSYIVGNEPISNFIPLTNVSGVKVTAFTAGPVEAVGGLKMDFLVVSCIKDINDCIKLIQKRHCGQMLPSQTINGRFVEGHRIIPTDKGLADVYDLPEDQAVFDDISSGRTETVFQFNTNSAIQWLRHFNHVKRDGNKTIDSIEKMSAFTALDRPGPLDAYVTNPETGQKHNMLVEYARRARGATKSDDILPVFDELFPETYGVLTYQEQLEAAYKYLTGCSAAEAEEFRSNVAKKKKDKVDAAYPKFVERAGAKIGEESAKAVWSSFVSWGQYGFNKSHSVGYVVIAYTCAYIKHYYPLEWWCCVLNNADKNEINDDFWKFCGNIINLPDVKNACKDFEIIGDRIQAPIRLLKGIGEKAHNQLVESAPYTSLEHFCQSIHNVKEAKATFSTKTVKKKGVDVVQTVKKLGLSAINRSHVYTLIVSGAMDSLFPEDLPLNDRMLAFDECMLKISGKKVSNKKDFKPLTPLERYQVRKAVLPAYGDNLIPLVSQVKFDHLHAENGKLFWHSERNVPFVGKVATRDPFITRDRLEVLEQVTMLPDKGFQCAIVGYVEGCKHFKYQQNKEALKLQLEVGGGKYEYVFWPDRETGKLPKHVKDVEPGCIVSCWISRTKDDRPFNVRDVVVIQPPLKEEDAQED
jgi:DNA polymerase III alpha subunit